MTDSPEKERLLRLLDNDQAVEIIARSLKLHHIVRFAVMDKEELELALDEHLDDTNDQSEAEAEERQRYVYLINAIGDFSFGDEWEGLGKVDLDADDDTPTQAH